MGTQTHQGQWKMIRGKIKEQWGDLTDDDLDEFEGKREELVGRIQKRYGQHRDEIEKKISEIFDRAAG